jgi:hypothetical protein
MVVALSSLHLLNQILDISETIGNSKPQQHPSILFQYYFTKVWVPENIKP